LACEELRKITESCHGTLKSNLWEEAVVAPAKLENADDLCQWLTDAASKSGPNSSPEQPQTLRRQILGGMNHAMEATAYFIAPGVKTLLSIGNQLSAVSPH
jgi:hypothetical protein